VEQVGHEQQLVGELNRTGIGRLVGVQRVQRVERHELDARRLIDPFSPDLRHNLFIRRRVAWVAISVRQTD
jgi:hypothetical protein